MCARRREIRSSLGRFGRRLMCRRFDLFGARVADPAASWRGLFRLRLAQLVVELAGDIAERSAMASRSWNELEANLCEHRKQAHGAEVAKDAALEFGHGLHTYPCSGCDFGLGLAGRNSGGFEDFAKLGQVHFYASVCGDGRVE